jgi:predicted nucleic acid-binding protein
MVFLDANVLIELIVPGRAKYSKIRDLLSRYNEVYVSMLSVHLCWHFGRQAGVSDELIAAIIDPCNLLTIDPEDYYWARQYEIGKDFEDALQLSCALRAHCNELITLDKDFAKRYSDSIEFVVL